MFAFYQAKGRAERSVGGKLMTLVVGKNVLMSGWVLDIVQLYSLQHY